MHNESFNIFQWLLLLFIAFSCNTKKAEPHQGLKEPGKRWSEERANQWYEQQPWLVGANFNPSTAINQLEFWQAETFDPETIDRELSWSASLGMNCHRVYLHNLLWNQDSIGFLQRIDQYLEISERYKLKTMLVLLDDVWDPYPRLGRQPDPKPHVHNSGWVQAPGAQILGDSTRHHELKGYVKGVLSHFANDQRVIAWDLYNEPDNTNKKKYQDIEDKHLYSLALLKKVFAWAREIDPSQPLTAGLWKPDHENWAYADSLQFLERFMLLNSDVISFHAYDEDPAVVSKKINDLKTYNRPLLCTEYLARGVNNTFENLLPLFKENEVAAINWGLVAGKTNTMYPWSSWRETFTAEPELWHHDILRKDGTPFKQEEVDFIKQVTHSN